MKITESLERTCTPPDSDIRRLNAAQRGRPAHRTAEFYSRPGRFENRPLPSVTEQRRRNAQRLRRTRERQAKGLLEPEPPQQQPDALCPDAVRAAQAVPVHERTVSDSAFLLEARAAGLIKHCGYRPADGR